MCRPYAWTFHKLLSFANIHSTNARCTLADSTPWLASDYANRDKAIRRCVGTPFTFTEWHAMRTLTPVGTVKAYLLMSPRQPILGRNPLTLAEPTAPGPNWGVESANVQRASRSKASDDTVTDMLFPKERKEENYQQKENLRSQGPLGTSTKNKERGLSFLQLIFQQCTCCQRRVRGTHLQQFLWT